MRAEINKVVEDSSRKLLQISSPPVKHWLLRVIMEKGDEDSMMKQTNRECAEYPAKLRLLSKQSADGTWPISRQKRFEEERGPGPPIGWTYVTILRNQYTLGDYITNIDEGHVRASFEKVFGWQTKEGYISGPWTNAFPLPYYNGFAVRNMQQFGLFDDPRTQRLIRWILSMQRQDGGWNIPYIQDMWYRPKYRCLKKRGFMDLVESEDAPAYDPKDYDDIPSCIWSTVMAIRGLTYHKLLHKSAAVRRGIDFILDRFFKRNYHASFYQSEKNWTRFKYPTYLGSGLSALDILTWNGYGPEDPRMEKPIRWLLAARTKEGFWHVSERPNPEKDQWITVVALAALKRYLNMY
ncbi:MAG: hypothetical protein KKE24_03325 [Candidatus Thermoplasmatota archaeon]|nr:hypothetical protein [Candidatus Thermoplasmatota archaeon]